MKKKLAAVFLAAMLSVEPCSMVYAEDFAESVSAESDIDLTEGVEAEAEPEAEPEEAQELEIAGSGDSSEIEETETEDEELFFDSGEDVGKAEASETESIGYSKNASVDDVTIISEPTKKKYDYGIAVSDIDLSGLAVEIHYTDKTKETLKFSRIDETIKDSRGHSYRSKLIKYTEDSDYYDTVEYIDSLGTYQVVIENDDNEFAEWYEVICSAKINVVAPSNVISLQKSGKDVYSGKVSAGKFGKFVPEKNGEYLFSVTVVGESYAWLHIYDSKLNEIMYGHRQIYDLKKGCTYYMTASDNKAATFTAELVPTIKSIQLEDNFQKVTYYTPVNFGTGEKNKYSIVPSPWLGKKLKITYTNGTTESVGIYKSNRFYGLNSAYIVYSGKQSVPEAGTYDVHFELGGKEAVLKNGIQIKKLSQMPAIGGEGTKEMAVTGGTVYACLKTTSATSYTIKCEPETHRYLTVSQLKNGKLEQVLSVENGKKCTLKPNSVYYIGMRLHSSVLDHNKVKFTVTQPSGKTQISKTKITVGTLPYTGSNVKPSVIVKNGSKTLRQGTDYTISYTKAKKVGAAVKITIGGKGSYTGKIVKTAYIIPAKTTLSSVKAGKKNITVTYKKVTGVSGYQIAYSTKKSGGYKYLNLNSKTYKKTITRLTSGRKYYVRVRAYKTINNKKYYGSFSAIKTVKVK